MRILGTYVPTANYLKIPELMKELLRDVNRVHKDIISYVSILHSRFEKIHPFADGNGRIGRLFMHVMLLQNNLPPAIIKQKNKRFYNAYLNKAQLKDDSSLLEDFVYDAVLGGI